MVKPRLLTIRSISELQSAPHPGSGSASSATSSYLEFGGKALDDHHAFRVLPGFELTADPYAQGAATR